MKIIGIDPGTNITGYSVISEVDNAYKIISIGSIKNNPKAKLQAKIANIYAELNEIIDKYSPEVASLENIFYGKNVKSLIKLAHIRGVILLLLEQKSLEIFEFSPREVKLSVTGYGNASKQQIQFMISRIFNIPSDAYNADAYDAAAIAFSAANRIGKRKLFWKFQQNRRRILWFQIYT